MSRKFDYRLTAALLGTAATIVVVHYPVAMAQLSEQAIASLAKQVTVVIEGQNPGSGVIVSKQGDTYSVLTAKHVVPTEDEYEIVTPDEQRYLLDYSQVTHLPDIDLALIQFSSTHDYRVVELGDSNQATEGMKVYIAGWPHPEPPITESIFVFTNGSIAARFTRPLSEGYGLVYTNVTRVGMSGGPVMDGQGNLIGIHGQAQGKEVYLPDYETVAVKTGFNLGIPINNFINSAVQAKVDLPSMPGSVSTPASPASSTYFAASLRLVEAATTRNERNVRGATYYFTISLPDNAGEPLQQIDLEQRQGVDFVRFHINESKAFVGTRQQRGEELPLDMVIADRDTRTISVTFDPPVPPGRTVTIGLRPVRNPRRSGVYIFRVKAFPPGEAARSRVVGTARLQFYDSFF